jgi:ATP-binding protein involved in chromosome partitioning
MTDEQEQVPEIKPSPTLERRAQQMELQQKIDANMARIKHKIAVISGKGGVGKTTVAANLVVKFAETGKPTGALDIDITGPTLHKLLGIDIEQPEIDPVTKTIIPAKGPLNIKVMSTAFLLPDDTTPVIWRGPMKMGVLREYLGAVNWGDLEYLVIDLPPGTGDETLDIMQLVKPLDGVVVTTAQELSTTSVGKTIVMAEKMGVKVLGVVENMSVYKCTKCGHEERLFGAPNGAKKLALDLGVPFLGSIPLDPVAVQQAIEHVPAIMQEKDTPAKEALNEIYEKINEQLS